MEVPAAGRAPAAVILSNLPGSFPWSVLHDRHPALLRQVRQGHPYPPDRLRALADLEHEIDTVIGPLPGDGNGGEDVEWVERAREFVGRSWYEVPFLWAENIFYLKLLAATGWSGTGPWRGVDPFGPVKADELAGPEVDAELAALAGLDPTARGSGPVPVDGDAQLDALLLSALWGNRADLGFLLQRPDSGPGPAQVDRLLVDHRERLRQLLPGERGTVTLIADNAGRELLPDLVLLDHLLVCGRAGSAVLHVKPSPYFVSDATVPDVLAALDRLRTGPPAAARIGHRLCGALGAGRLVLRAHPFSVSPLGYDDMPPDLREELASSSITLLKGDLNYRRLVGDRAWPATSPFGERTSGFPGPVAVLRTLKSDVVVGLPPALLAPLDAAEADPGPGPAGRTWRTSGGYGLIQVSG